MNTKIGKFLTYRETLPPLKPLDLLIKLKLIKLKLKLTTLKLKLTQYNFASKLDITI